MITKDPQENPLTVLTRLAQNRDRTLTQISTAEKSRDTAKEQWEKLQKEVNKLLKELRVTESAIKNVAKELVN